jgi:hypothetical protein
MTKLQPSSRKMFSWSPISEGDSGEVGGLNEGEANDKEDGDEPLVYGSEPAHRIISFEHLSTLLWAIV